MKLMITMMITTASKMMLMMRIMTRRRRSRMIMITMTMTILKMIVATKLLYMIITRRNIKNLYFSRSSYLCHLLISLYVTQNDCFLKFPPFRSFNTVTSCVGDYQNLPKLFNTSLLDFPKNKRLQKYKFMSTSDKKLRKL